MKNIFIWDEHNHYFIDEHGQYILQEKPIFSFEYDKIIYHNDTQSYFINDNGFNMNEQQCSEIENFIEQKRDEIGILKHCIDKNGKYLGFVNVEREDVFKSISITPLTADNFWIWNEETSEWKRAYYYNAEGKLVDVNSNDVVDYTFQEPPKSVLSQKWDKNKNMWVDDYTQDELKKYKKNEMINLVLLMLVSTSSNTDIEIVVDQLEPIFSDNFKYHVTKTALGEIKAANNVNDVIKTIQSVKDVLLFIE